MKLKRILSFILASLMLLSATACGNKETSSTTAKPEAVTEEKMPEVPNEDYAVVIDKENAGAVFAAERMVWQMKEQYGIDLEVVDHKEKAYVKEIVLGKTNRGENIDTSKMVCDEYEIRAVGEKVFIDGASDDGLYGGAVELLNTCTDEKGFNVAKDYFYKDTSGYPIKKLTINGNDIAKYTIIYPENASEKTMIGVNDMIEYIEKATGVKIEVTSKTSDYVIIVEEKIVKVEGAGNDLDSFKVKSEGNSIRLTGSAERGAMYACYELLEQIGWRFLAEDVDFIRPAAEKDIAGLDLTESSVFADRRIYTGTFNYSEDMRNKLRDIDTRAFAGGACHTFDNLDGDYSTQSENQPCLTDPAVYELMLKNVMKLLENNPSANFISISQNDNGNYCKCDNCMAAMKKYEDENGKGGPAGLMIEFVNKFALEIEKEYPDVLIHTFAYTYTRSAPKNITPHDNVAVQLCSIECCFSHGLTNDRCNQNVPFTKDISDWAKLSDNLHIWDYYINFWFRGTPFPNLGYDVLAENLQFFTESNVTSLFLQGNGDCKNNGEFDHLRSYLIAKLAWNPYMSEEEYDTHIRDFMEGFYGEGWESVYEAFTTLHDNYRTAQNHLCVFDRPTDTWMPRKLKPYLDDLITLMDTAKLKSESYKKFCAVDASQVQFDFMKCDLMFNELYKSGDPEKVKLSQDMSFDLQKKMQKYEIILGDGNKVPNYAEFTCSPSLWKLEMQMQG